MSSIIRLEEEELQRKVIELIKHDKRFQLWLKSHYSMNLFKKPPMKGELRREGLDKVFFFFIETYDLEIKKKAITLLNKIKYYIQDLIIFLRKD